MKITSAAVGLALAGLASTGCSDKHDAASGNIASPTAPAAPAMSTPKPGLWQMTVSADGMPNPMTMQVCVGAPAPGVNPFTPPSQPGQACSKNSFSKTAAGYSVDTECQMNGMTISAKGEVSGDFSSSYTIAMKTRMAGADLPAAMQTERASTVTAKYVGACPSGMAPGSAKQG